MKTLIGTVVFVVLGLGFLYHVVTTEGVGGLMWAAPTLALAFILCAGVAPVL